MAEHYTDEDVEAATGAILRAFDEIFCDGLDRKAGPAEHAGAKAYARAVLDAVAPAIAARAKAEAWDEGRSYGASDYQSYRNGDGNCGPDAWDCRCPNPYRADEIEGR